MKIEILFPGRLKNDFAKIGFDEYIKRLSKFLKIEVVSLPSVHSQNPSVCVEEESKKLLKYLCDREFVLLDSGGLEMNTEEMSYFMRSQMKEGKDLTFVVGGVYGVSTEIKNVAKLKISLSKMTFTHSISLLLLSEQLYRSMKIISGQPYDH